MQQSNETIIDQIVNSTLDHIKKIHQESNEDNYLQNPLTEISEFINSDKINELINDEINNWHNSDSAISLHGYLGLTWEEYGRWVENSNYLETIILGKILIKRFDRILEILK